MKGTFAKGKLHSGMKTAALMITFSLVIGGCGSKEEVPQPEMAYETGTLNLGTGAEGSVIHQAGWKVSDIISNTVPGIYVMVEESKGAMVNADNVADGSMDLALIPGDVAYDAANGRNLFANDKKEELRVLGACYQEVSGWITPKDTGMSQVEDLKGKIISCGSRGSVTDLVSKDVFDVLGIDGSNTEVYADSISASVGHLKEGTADSSHVFSAVPNAMHESFANDVEAVVLSYSEELLNQIIEQEPWYFKTEIPAAVYAGQDDAVPTFGRKVLLCANKEMDEDLAYEIARALDLNGPVYTAGSRFMSEISDKEFLCNELLLPLHEGAERYYKELGYLKK